MNKTCRNKRNTAWTTVKPSNFQLEIGQTVFILQASLDFLLKIKSGLKWHIVHWLDRSERTVTFRNPRESYIQREALVWVWGVCFTDRTSPFFCTCLGMFKLRIASRSFRFVAKAALRDCGYGNTPRPHFAGQLVAPTCQMSRGGVRHPREESEGRCSKTQL